MPATSVMRLRDGTLTDLRAPGKTGENAGEMALGRRDGFRVHEPRAMLRREFLDRADQDGPALLARARRFVGVGCRHVELVRSEEHTSELQSLAYLVCRLLLEKKKKYSRRHYRVP